MSGRMLARSNLIEVRQGDSFSIRLHIKKSHQNLDLSSSKLNMQVRDNEDNIVINKQADAIDIKSGKMIFILTPEDTNVPVGDYKVDIELSLPDGSINTIFPADVNKIGIFRITEQVTR